MTSTTITKLAHHWAEKYSGINQFITLQQQQQQQKKNNNLDFINKLSVLKKSAEHILHTSGSISANTSNMIQNILLLDNSGEFGSIGGESGGASFSSSGMEMDEATAQPRSIGKIVTDVTGKQKVEVLLSASDAAAPEISSTNNNKILDVSITSSSENLQQEQQQQQNLHFLEGDIVCGIISSSANLFIVSGVVLPSCCIKTNLSNNNDNALLEETAEILRTQFASLVPGVPLATTLSLKESSVWSRLRMSLFSVFNGKCNILTLIEKLTHHTATSFPEKKAALVSDFLLALHQQQGNLELRKMIIKEQRNLLSLLASVFADALTDSIVERAGCTVMWWRQKLLFASSPLFITLALSTFFLTGIISSSSKTTRNNYNNNNNNNNIEERDEEEEEQIETQKFFTETLLNLVSHIGKHIERMLSLSMSPNSNNSGTADVSLLAPFNIIELCQEATESLSVISLVLKSWKDLSTTSSSSFLHQQQQNSAAFANETLPNQQNFEDPQIELPTHIEGDVEKEKVWIRQAAADLYIIAPTSITKTQLCVVDAILRGISHTVSKVSAFTKVTCSQRQKKQQKDKNNNNLNNSNIVLSCWFSAESDILPTIPDHEVGARPIALQLARLESNLIDKIHTHSIQEAEDIQTILEKYLKVWNQQQQALQLVQQGNSSHQQQLLLQSLSEKLQTTISHLLSTENNLNNNTNSSSSSSSSAIAQTPLQLRYSKLLGRLHILKLLRTISTCLFSQKRKLLSLNDAVTEDEKRNLFHQQDENEEKAKNGVDAQKNEISILLDPSPVGSWIETNLSSCINSKPTPKFSLLRESTSEFSSRLVLHGRKQQQRVNNKTELSSSSTSLYPSLGALVVCAAGQNFWLIWFTVASEIILPPQQQQQNGEEDKEQQQYEEVALAINLLHHEASLVQALMSAAEMSREDLIVNNNDDSAASQTDADERAGSFCVFFNDSASAHVWLSAVTTQMSFNTTSGTSSSSLFAAPSSVSLSLKPPSLTREQQQDQELSKDADENLSSSLLSETLRSFENKNSFALSKSQKSFVEQTVLNSISSKSSTSESSTDNLCSLSLTQATTQLSRSGKTTCLIQAAAARMQVIQSKIFLSNENATTRKKNHTRISLPNAASFRSNLLLATSSTCHQTEETRKEFLQQLALFQQQSDREEGPTLFITKSGNISHVRKEISRLIGSTQGGNNNNSDLISHHFENAAVRCTRAPFILNLLKQQESLRSKIQNLAKTLSGSSASDFYSDERLSQILSPNQFRILTAMTQKMKSITNHQQQQQQQLYPMNRDLYQLFKALRNISDDGENGQQNQGMFDEDFANLISDQSVSTKFGIQILPLSSLDNSFGSSLAAENNTNSTTSLQQLSKDVALLARLDFSRHSTVINDEISNSIRNALKYRCIELIKREFEESFSRFLFLSAQMRDFVESTAAQSVRSSPGRILVLDAERDLVGRFNFLMSPCRFPVLRSILIDDIEETLTSSSLICSASLLFRANIFPFLISANKYAESWRRNVLFATNNNNNNLSNGKKKLLPQDFFEKNFLQPANIAFTTNSATFIESLKTIAKTPLQFSSSNNNNNTTSKAISIIFPLSILQKFLLASELFSLLKQRILPLMINQNSNNNHDNNKIVSSRFTQIDIDDESIFERNTNSYVSYLTKLLANNLRNVLSAEENHQANTSSTSSSNVASTCSLLSRSIVRNISLWSIPVSFQNHNNRKKTADLRSDTNNSNNSGSGKEQQEQQERQEQLQNSVFEGLAVKLFFKCVFDALKNLSQLISEKNLLRVAFIAEHGTLLSLSFQDQIEASSKIPADKFQLFSDLTSLPSKIDSLVLIVIPNFVLSVLTTGGLSNRNVTDGNDRVSSASSLVLSPSPSSSLDAASKILSKVSESIICISSDEFFNQALRDQNNIIAYNAHEAKRQQQQQSVMIMNRLLTQGGANNNSNNNSQFSFLSSSSTNTTALPPPVSSAVWIRQLLQSASYARAPLTAQTYSATTIQQDKADAETDADSIFYPNGNRIAFEEQQQQQMWILNNDMSFGGAGGGTDDSSSYFYSSMLLRKSHSSALEICCPRHRSQSRGFLVFSASLANQQQHSSTMQNMIVSHLNRNSSLPANEIVDQLFNELLSSGGGDGGVTNHNNNNKKTKQSSSFRFDVSSIHRLLPEINNHNQKKNSSSGCCSGLFGQCHLPCLARYDRCSARSHMCLEICHDLTTTADHQYHSSHQTSCPFLCNKKLPCGHSSAQDCGTPCQCSFDNQPVVVLERNCGESCIVGVETVVGAEKLPKKEFYKHHVIIPCQGVDPNTIDIDNDLPPCQEEVEVECSHCESIIKCLCCDVQTFRISASSAADDETVNPADVGKLFCNLCREQSTRPQPGSETLEKLRLRNKMLAKRTALLAARDGAEKSNERISLILKRREDLKAKSESVLKGAAEEAKKRMIGDVMKAKDILGSQEQILSELRAHRVQMMNIVRDI